MTKDPFTKSIDQTRLNRLRGDVLAFVSDYEEQGYTNMEITRALIWAGFERGGREDLLVRENFYTFLRDSSIEHLARREDLINDLSKQARDSQIN